MKLEKYLHEFWNIFQDLYANTLLVIPNHGIKGKNLFSYEVRKLKGTRTPFLEIDVETSSSMQNEVIYLLNNDRLKPLKLLPFFRIIKSHITNDEACYFYNSKDEQTVNWVSYHYHIDSNIQRELDEELRDALLLFIPNIIKILGDIMKKIMAVSHPIPTEYAERIYQDGKKVFVGKSYLGKVSKGDKFIIYESHGAKAYTGWANIKSIGKEKTNSIY